MTIVRIDPVLYMERFGGMVLGGAGKNKIKFGGSGGGGERKKIIKRDVR